MVLQESSIKVRLLQLWLLSQGPQGANRALTEHELCVQNTVELNFALELMIWTNPSPTVYYVKPIYAWTPLTINNRIEIFRNSQKF